MGWFGRLFEQYKFARRASLIWSWVLITYTIFHFFGDLASIEEHHVKFLLAILGLLSTVVFFYHESRRRDDRKEAGLDPSDQPFQEPALPEEDDDHHRGGFGRSRRRGSYMGSIGDIGDGDI